jgi:rhomboid family GlyGly-CTERM serine protease
VTGLQRLFAFRGVDAVIPVLLVVTLAAFYLAGPTAIESVRYDRAAVLGGEAWRLVTGHLVHADAAHFGWNVVGVLIVAVLFSRDYTPRQWLVVLLASLAAIDLGFLLLEPQLDWYVGFSGVLHGMTAAGIVAWLRATRDPVTWIIVSLFAAKLVYEHYAGALPFTSGSLSLPVVHEAHSYGAVGGLVAALWLGRRPTGWASL